jgi:cystathionine beta-synthase
MDAVSLGPSQETGVYQDVSGTIGRTPLVRLNRVTRGLACSVYAKLEMFNPGGSVKDRIAFPMVEGYKRSGQLKPGGTVVEATSGNTGIGLAIACALKGYQAILVMPDKMSEEKIRLLRAYGARVVLTPTSVSPDDPRSYYSVARRLVKETPGAILANQYHNPDNPLTHYRITGPEIWHQTQGKVTDLVIGMGTGGTISGVARFMKQQSSKVRIIGVDPQGSILAGAWRQGGSSAGLNAATYKVEGIGEDFIPTTLDLSLVDEVQTVDDSESFLWARRLLREEGIFCGGSSGSALAGALKACERYGPDRLVVVIFPDSGSRYLSKLFDDDWMREHGFVQAGREGATALGVARSRGLPSLITARAGDSLTEVIGRMRRYGVSQLPVVDEQGALGGIVSESDLLDYLLAHPSQHDPGTTIEVLVTAPAPTIPDDLPLAEALPRLMVQKVLVLMGASQRPVGILMMIDALEFLSAPEPE